VRCHWLATRGEKPRNTPTATGGRARFVHESAHGGGYNPIFLYLPASGRVRGVGMSVRSILLGLEIAVATLLATSPVHAECFVLAAKYVMEQKAVEVVFSGTVVSVTRTSPYGYRATFDVDRVWKGSVPKRFDLYVWELAAEVPGFVLGQHSVVLAQRLTYTTREGVGIEKSDADAFGPAQCSMALDANIVRDLGPGESPK